MEVKILDSIMHGVLKPWKIDTTNKRWFTELVRTANAVSPKTIIELQNQLKALVTDYPSLQKALAAETPNINTALQPLFYKLDLPKYNDLITQFYYSVIKAETLCVFNIFLQQTASLTEQIDIRYEVIVMLKRIGALTQQTAKELRERGFATIPDEQSDLIHFALYYLKHSLIILYFGIQECFKESLLQVITLENFYLQDLEEPISNMLPLEPVTNVTELNNSRKAKSNKFSFGFKGDTTSLRTAITQLCLKLDLVNDTMNTEDEFFQTLTSKDLKSGTIKINIGCETVEFRYILLSIKPYFDNLTFASVATSAIFFSKQGTQLTAQNLYSSKITAPKTKEEIDNIIKHLK